MYEDRIGSVSSAFRQALQIAFKDLPIAIEKMAAKVGELTSLASAVSVLTIMQGAGQNLTCEIKFLKGDIMLALPAKYGDKKALFKQAFGAQWEHAYNEWVKCATVAKSWPVHLRNGSLPWNYYRNNKPGTSRSYNTENTGSSGEDTSRTGSKFVGHGDFNAFLKAHGMHSDLRIPPSEENTYILNTETMEATVEFCRPQRKIYVRVNHQGDFAGRLFGEDDEDD